MLRSRKLRLDSRPRALNDTRGMWTASVSTAGSACPGLTLFCLPGGAWPRAVVSLMSLLPSQRGGLGLGERPQLDPPSPSAQQHRRPTRLRPGQRVTARLLGTEVSLEQAIEDEPRLVRRAARRSCTLGSRAPSAHHGSVYRPPLTVGPAQAAPRTLIENTALGLQVTAPKSSP